MTPSQIFLGQMLRDNDIYYKAQPNSWWFADAKDCKVFETIESVLQANLKADVLAVGSKFDAAYISLLTNDVTADANWKYYAKKVKAQGARRLLNATFIGAAEGLETRKVTEVIEDVTNAIEKIVGNSSDFKIQSLSELLPLVVQDLDERYQSRGQLRGLSTGYDNLDMILGGLQDEKLYIIGARPSGGKSALALNMVSSIASHTKAGFISLESSWREMVLRALSTESGVNSQKIQSGYISKTDFDCIFLAMERLDKKELYIYDKPNCSLIEVIGQCRRMVSRHGAKIIFIDYMQLIRTEADSDRERVATVSKRLKDLARELKIPIVALAQLRRDSDGRRPELGDFQHTSQIEQDADGAMLIHRQVVDVDGKILKKTRASDPGEEERIFLQVEKNRDGMTGDVEMHWCKETVKFIEKEHK